MYKLLMRAFPGFHRANSVYALFPFTTPDKNREIFTKQGHANDYSYDPPSFIGPPIPVITWQGVVDVLNDQERFKVPCELKTLAFHSWELYRLIFEQGGSTPFSSLNTTTC
jgi:hypothetical protein